MNQVNEAVARYHKILESEPFRELDWVEQLKAEYHSHQLEISGRPISPFLRPNFITRRQYDALVKGGEALSAAIDRVRQLVFVTPALLNRIDMLPGERMLSELNPGYKHFATAGLFDASVNNGSMRFSQYSAEAPVGVLYSDLLADIFYDSAPVKEFRKRNKLAKLPGAKYLHAALLKAWKEFGGKRPPNIAILEFKLPFETVESREYLLLKEYFAAHGNPCERVYPGDLEYSNGKLRKGSFEIDLIYRRVRTQEFLVRYDLSAHPLVRAYRDRAVCMVNSFRADIAQRKAIFDLLTDDVVTAKFPAAEKKAIRAYVPTTRVVTERKAMWKGQEVDLPAFILENRESLVLRPNADSDDQPEFNGRDTDQATWERAVKRALRERYVVQELTEPVTSVFPVLQYGELAMKELRVDVQPHTYLGKVQSCSTWLSSANSGYSAASGVTPTFLLGSK